MFNKLAESYNRVRSKADEVRQTVSQQAAKAREALGIPSFLQHSDASRLERELEHQASQVSSSKELHELLVKNIAQIATSSDVDAPLYFNYPQSTTFDFPSFILGASPPPKSFSGISDTHNIPAGDLSSTLSWISPYRQKQSTAQSKKDDINSSSTDLPPPPPPAESDQPSQASYESKQRTDSGHTLCAMNGMTFKQIFLRSQALEILLLTIARLDFRSKLVGPLDDEGIDQSTSGALHRLMALTMRGDRKLHQELLFLFCSVDLNSEAWEVHLRHLAELTALLKIDWQDDYYQDSIRRMTTEIDALRHAIHQITVPPLPADHPSSMSSSSTQFEVTEYHSHGRPGTEEYDAAVDAVAAQLEKRSEHSRRIAEIRLKIDQMVEQSAERSKVADEMISKRMTSLLASADSLSQRFCNLQSRAADKSEVVAHESKEAAAQVEKRLTEATSHKVSVDADVEQLQNQRRELLSQLEALEMKLVSLLAEQRKAHDALDSLQVNRETLKKSFDHKAAVASELMRQSELHEIDMKNMKILIEQSKGVIQKGEQQSDQVLIQEKSRLGHQFKANVVNHVEFEVERLKVDSERLGHDLKMLEDVWKSRQEKEKELEQRREQYRACQSEYQRLIERLRAEEVKELNGALSSDASRLRNELEQKGKELERAAVEATAGGLEILKAGFHQAQWRCLNSSTHLDTIWKSLTQFVENVFSHIKVTEAPTASTTSSAISKEDDEFVDVGTEEFVDAHSSSNASPASPLSEKDNSAIALEAEMKALIATAQSIYTKAKKASTAKSHLLSNESHKGV